MSSAIFKPWLVLVLIFLAGVGTGILLTVGLGSHFKHPPGVQIKIMKRHWMAHLTEKLNLTADQQAKIDPILTDATNQLQTLHHDEMDKANRIMESVNSQISALLTPDQKEKLQQLESERNQEFPGHPHPWLHSGGPPPGMGGQGEPGGSSPTPSPTQGQ